MVHEGAARAFSTRIPHPARVVQRRNANKKKIMRRQPAELFGVMCILPGVGGVTRPNLFGSARLFGLLTLGSGDTIFFIIISGVAREKNSLGNCMGKESSAGTQSTALSTPRAVGHISSIKKKCAAIFSCFRCVRL